MVLVHALETLPRPTYGINVVIVNRIVWRVSPSPAFLGVVQGCASLGYSAIIF